MNRTGDDMQMREIKPLNAAQEEIISKAFDGSFLENMRKLRELREKSYKEHEMREQKKREDAAKQSDAIEEEKDSNIDLNEVN